MKKIFALVLATMLVLASLTVAFADPTPHSITIHNTNSNISINGKTYSAYKLFDSTHSGTAYAYSMSTSNQFYDAKLVSGENVEANSLVALLRTYFTFTANTSDSTKINVVPKDGFNTTQARTFADAIQPFLSSKTADANSSAATNETATITLANDAAGNGYYIVTGSAIANDGKTPANEIVSAVILTNEDPNAQIQPKADAPKLDKKITSSDGNTTTTAASDKDGRLLDEKGQAAVAAVGKVVGFEIDSKVPDMTGYTKYLYKINDTMSAGLDYVADSMKLVVGTMNPVTILAVTTETTDEQKAAAAAYIEWSNENRTFALTINKTTLDNAGKDADIVLTYNAKVNATALTYNYEKNTANLEYSRNPYNDSEKGKTPDEEVYVIDINIDVYKFNADDKDTKAKNAYADDVAAKADGYVKYEGTDKSDDKYWVKATTLSGAKFKIFKGSTQPADTANAWYKYDTSTNEATWVTKENADEFVTVAGGGFNPQVRGLAEGTYGLLETEAPNGYNLLTAPTMVTITAAHTADGTSATYTASAGILTGGTIDLSTTPAAQPVDTLLVENKSGTQLPSTGGIGTTIFYVAGSILVLAAVIFMVTKRRMNANND